MDYKIEKPLEVSRSFFEFLVKRHIKDGTARHSILLFLRLVGGYDRLKCHLFMGFPAPLNVT